MSPADMAHANMVHANTAICRRMSTLDANRCGILLSPSSYLHNHQASSGVSAPQKQPRVNREQGVVAATARRVAAYSVLILLLLLLLLLLLQARVPWPPRS